MNASARKMRRTKVQELTAYERGNREFIMSMARAHGKVAGQVNSLAKALQSLTNVLKAKGIVDELSLMTEIHAIEELERMQQQATIIDPSKGEGK